MYIETTKGLFPKIPAQLPKPQSSLREKRKSLLNDIGGEWCMNKLNDKLPTLKKRKLSKKHKKIG